MTVSNGRRQSVAQGGGVEPARPPLIPPLVNIKILIDGGRSIYALLVIYSNGQL